MFGRGYSERGGGGLRTFGFILSLVLGLYLLNGAFKWFKLPDQIVLIDNWIAAAAGALLIIYGISVMMRPRPYYPGY